MRIRVAVVLSLLFILSVAIRHPLFNQEFTNSHEWLSAHTLTTVELWNQVSPQIHHFNLLYTFPARSNKFVDDLWSAGVPDRFGNYYYVSMPHLGFLTPYLFFKLFHLPPNIADLEYCGLTLHLIVCVLLFLLLWRLTRGFPGALLASSTAFCVFLFAPTALYYYQNALVGSVMVIPYTVMLLIAVTVLFEDGASRAAERIAWLLLLLGLVGGCLADWQGYFTAFATAVVAFTIALRAPQRRRTAVAVLLLACVGVAIAILVTVLQDARIAGFDQFEHTILGRLHERTGGKNINPLTFDYYRRLARFYAAYLPFLIAAGAFFAIAVRRGYRGIPDLFRKAGIPLAISLLAVLADHLILANHTAIHIFTTLNTLVPIAIVCGLGAIALCESGADLRRNSLAVTAVVLLCAAISTGEYYLAYRNRPHPFRTSAATILAAAAPDDVIFAAGNGYRMDKDMVVPQMIYYLQRNVEVVAGEPEAAQFLAAHGLQRGVLARLNEDYTVGGIQVINVR
jgi:hypothetical protein